MFDNSELDIVNYWRCFNKGKPSDVSEGRHNTAFDEVEVEMTSKEKKRYCK